MAITLYALDEEFKVLAHSPADSVEEANGLAEAAFNNVPEIAFMEFFVQTDEEFAINLLSRSEFLGEGV